MRRAQDARLAAMRSELLHARELLDEEDHSAAKAVLLNLRAQCLRAGTPSAHVAWSLAAACDGLGEYAEALDHAREALRLDPLSLPYLRTHDSIVTHVREALGREARRANDPTTPRLYELLLASGEGDARSHMAMARWHLHRGEDEAAARILEAVVLLSPAVAEAWTLLAHAWRTAGNEARALEAEAEASAREHGPSRARA
jgi:predicted Zn-dependent protease